MIASEAQHKFADFASRVATPKELWQFHYRAQALSCGCLCAAQVKMYRNCLYTGIVARDARVALACEREYHEIIQRRHGRVPADHWDLILVGAGRAEPHHPLSSHHCNMPSLFSCTCPVCLASRMLAWCS